MLKQTFSYKCDLCKNWIPKQREIDFRATPYRHELPNGWHYLLPSGPLYCDEHETRITLPVEESVYLV